MDMGQPAIANTNPDGFIRRAEEDITEEPNPGDDDTELG